ncbi:hypothetical protein RSW15_24310, partial [Escherichia coli]|uniref:hypothetical protein n=1 Tax=Escherichia coli TaxID=562 RepID=UPI0028DFD441
MMAGCRDGELDTQAAASALQAIDWRPHARIVQDGTVTYRPWEQEPAAYWLARWPELYWASQGLLPQPPGESLPTPL